MLWKAAPPRPEPPRHELNHGPFTLAVTPSAEYGDQIQYISLYLCRRSDQDHDTCLALWPTEAISLVRQKLDDLEAYLEAHRCDTPQ